MAAELRQLWRGLTSRWLWLTLLLAALLFGLVYQVKQEYLIDVGGPLDDAFVGGFNAKLPKDAELSRPLYSHRWSREYAEVVLPGIGNQQYRVTIRAAGPQQGAATLRLNGPQFSWQTTPTFTEQTFTATRAGLTYGDLRIAITAATVRGGGEFCQPGQTACPLGLDVDWVRVAPSDYALTALVIPDFWTSLWLLLALAIIYLAVYSALGARAALVAGVVASLLLAAALLFARLELTVFSGQLVVVLLWGWLLSTAVLLLTRHAPAPSARGVLAVIVGFGFALRFGGMVHPQFVSSDLIFHAHKLDTVLAFFRGGGGNFYFEGYLPDGTPVPYPSAYYVLLSPLSALLGGSTLTNALLLRFASALLDAGVPLLLYLIASRRQPPPRPAPQPAPNPLPQGGLGPAGGVAAAGFYAVSPAVFQLYSAGNHSNIFAQTMFVAALAVASGAWVGSPLAGGRRWQAVGVGILLLALTVLGHYGMLIAAGGVLGLVALGWLLFAGGQRRRIVPLVAASGVALLASYLLYYGHYNSQIVGQVQQVLSGKGGAASPATLAGIAGQLLTWQGWVILPLAVAGLLLLGQQRADRWLVVLLAGWLAAGLLFALLELRVKDTVRYNYLLAPALSLLVGLTAGWLGDRAASRGRRVAVYTLLVGAALGYCLLVWGDLIFGSYRYPGKLY